jgi:hypothetical protein
MFPSSLATPIKLMGECKMSRLSNTLLTLIERAERKGEAQKRVRQGNIMGNAHSWGMTAQQWREYVKSTPIVVQWEVKIYTLAFQTVEVYHYDTLIFKAENFMPNGWRLLEWYGESASDRDALNGLVYHFGMSGKHSFRYFPSKSLFIDELAEKEAAQ